TQVEEMMKENPEGYKDFAHSIDRIAVHEGCKKYLKPDRELVRMFNSLKGDYDLFVLSNGNYEHIVNVLASLGVDYNIFNPIIDRDELEESNVGPKFKGNVGPFKYARKKLKRASKRIVYVGDDVGCDAEGKNIGMKTILTWRPKTKKSERTLVDWETKSIYDVPIAVRKLL
ncbi:MAG: HAD family hydrolase, partial [Candidatus Aenigmarchaeota archaeon]|nr:HAD family hydrolase [Candidatus Aenigmarchaeota archaeon]